MEFIKHPISLSNGGWQLEEKKTLVLGTKGTIGCDVLTLTLSGQWLAMDSIVATFTNEKNASVDVMVVDGEVVVPWEATQSASQYGSYIVFTGYKGDTVYKPTTNVPYKVLAHGNNVGSETQAVTPSMQAQFVAEVAENAEGAKEAQRNAELAKDAAEQALQELKQGIASGDFKGEPGKDGKDGRDGNDGYTPVKGVDYFDGQNGKDGRNGSDASVTAGNIRNALGFDPANAADLHTQSAEIASLTRTKVGYSEVVGNQLIMYSDATKEHLLATLDLPTGGGVEDVKVNGSSVVSDGVANVPVASNKNFGAVKTASWGGVIVYEDTGIADIKAATNSQIANRSSTAAINTTNFDYAVKAAMCDGKGAEWTLDEKLAAQSRVGVSAFGDLPLLAEFTTEDDDVSLTYTVDLGKDVKQLYTEITLPVAMTTTGYLYWYFGEERATFSYIGGVSFPSGIVLGKAYHFFGKETNHSFFSVSSGTGNERTNQLLCSFPRNNGIRRSGYRYLKITKYVASIPQGTIIKIWGR